MEGRPNPIAQAISLQKSNMDPLIVYLSIKKMDHLSKIDRSFIESVFESYSQKVQKDPDDMNSKISGAESDTQRLVTRPNSILAYKDIFKMWEINLTPEQSKRLLNIYFK